MPRTPAKKPSKVAAPAIKQAPTPQPPAATPQFVVGNCVVHPMFGDGTVSEVDADKLTIRFAQGPTRQIIAAFIKRR